MERRSFMRRALAAVGAVAVPSAAAAQSGRVSTTSGARRTEGMTFDGTQLHARLADGTYRGTVIGILTPPMNEPTLPSQHGAFWVHASGPADATLVQLKVNFNGNVLVLGEATWSLQ